MADKDINTSEKPSQRLNRLVQEDLTNRIDWFDMQKRIRRDRLGERRHRRAMYPGYPNFLEPIIDDNVRAVTSAESSVIWSGTRYLANFVPLTEDSADVKRRAEQAFDSLLRINPGTRAKIDALLDRKNEGGMSVAKMIERRDIIVGEVVPDFEEVDPFDLIVPTGTRNLRDAERVTHVIRYTEREFRNIAKEQDWNNVEEVIRRTHTKQSRAREGSRSVTRFTESDPSLVGLNSLPTNTDWIIVYEVYHYDDDREKGVTIYSPAADELPLASFAWTYPSKRIEGKIVFELRPWPFVQFRYENRSLFYYDTRGIGHLLADNQKEASQLMNAKGVMIDYTTFPFIKGDRGALQNFKFRPGEVVPTNFELVTGGRLDPALDLNIDRVRQVASRRVGGAQGAQTSPLSVKTPKTATEINSLTQNSNRLSSDTIMRFSEPLGDLFQMMYDFMKNHPLTLPAATRGGMVFLTADDMKNSEFKVVPAISSRNFNPDFILAQLRDMSPLLINNPVLRQAKFTQLMMDQIDPFLTEEIIFDPEEEGTEGSDVPLVQQMEQLMQIVQQMAVVVDGNREQLTAMAGLDAAEGEEQPGGDNVEPAVA